MELKKLEHHFTVCKVEDFSQVNLEDEFCFIGKTDEERSVVCLTDHTPSNVTEREDGWRAFRIQGVLDFSLIGILAKIAALLTEHKISIFAVSTYNTDYILTREENYQKAIQVLSEAGYQIAGEVLLDK